MRGGQDPGTGRRRSLCCGDRPTWRTEHRGARPLNSRWFLDVNALVSGSRFAHAMARAFHSWAALALLAVIAVLTYLRARSGRTSGGLRQLAASLWSPCGAAIAYLVALPIARAVGQPRPYEVLAGVTVLVHRATTPGLPDADAALALAVATGCLLARDRLLSALGTLVALAVAFNDCYVGLNFPADAAAGLGLGLVVAVVTFLLARPVLDRAIAGIGRSPLGAALAPAMARSRNPLAPTALPAASEAGRASSAGPAGRPIVLGATGAVRVLEDRPISPRPAQADGTERNSPSSRP